MKRAPAAMLDTRVREIAARVAETSGLELVLAEFVRAGSRWVVRFTIDREGGVTLDDCAMFSRRVGAALEAEDPIPATYTLEVSSPGLDRRLVTPSDYERFAGRRAKISLGAPLEGRRNFTGVIRALEDGSIVLDMEAGQVARIPVESVEMARLIPEF